MNVIGRYARLGAIREVSVTGPLAGLGAILGNASSLSATAIVTPALGFVFWSLAAREAPPAAVGLAAAAVSASALLATVSMLGFGTLLIGEVAAGRDRETKSALLSTAILVVCACGIILGAAFGVLGPGLIQQFQPLSGGGLPFVGLFAVAVGGSAVGGLVDQLMVGFLRGELQLGRNTLYSLAKLAALFGASPLLRNDQGLVIFAVWPLGNLLSIAALGAFLLWKPIGIRLGRPRLDLLHSVGGAALGHHAVNLSLQAPALALPVLVTILLSTTANAYFYTAWMITSVAVLPQTALATTLYALASREPAVLSARARLTFGLGLLEGVAAIVVVQIAATWLLAGFGASYASEASLSLRILILAVIPGLIKTHFVALSRVRRRLRAAGVAVAAGACVELIAAAVGGSLAGLPGLGLGWLVGLTLEAVCMLPYVWRTLLSGTTLLAWVPRREHSHSL